MLCPSCRRSISAESIFCMFCGVRLSSFLLGTPVSATRLPSSIGHVQVYFDGKVKLACNGQRLKRPDVARDSFCVDFQLLDSRGTPIACNGIADLNLKVIQVEEGKSRSPKTLLKTKASIKLKASLFEHDPKGQPYYHYLYPAPIVIKMRGFQYPSCDVAIKVIAEGGREPLYKQTQVSADPVEQTNRIVHLVEESPISV